VARGVEAETEMAISAVVAPIGADEENPPKEGLQEPFYSRSMDGRVSAAGTPRMT
jgi:hypothetical protein